MGGRPAHKAGRGAGGKLPFVGWWDEEIDNEAEESKAALHHPVQRGQGIALSDINVAAR